MEHLIAAADSTYRRWLDGQSGSKVLADGMTTLYARDDLAERNRTYEVQKYLPRHLMIGQEGDTAIVIATGGDSAVSSIDLGSLAEDDFHAIAPSFAQWEQSGFALPEEPEYHLPHEAAIFVDKVPLDAIRTLQRIKSVLNVDWPASELRGLLAQQPFMAVERGYPIRLEGALLKEPDLAPYLFYGAKGNLTRIA